MSIVLLKVPISAAIIYDFATIKTAFIYYKVPFYTNVKNRYKNPWAKMPFISSQTDRKSKREILFRSWGYKSNVEGKY